MIHALAAMTVLICSGATAPVFSTARPVWLEGRETEMNVFAGFRGVFENPEASSVQVRVAAATLYRVFVNGAFVGHGPARGPHGYYRVDEWDIAPQLKAGANVVALEVAGYNANSYYVLDQPSFVQAEVVADGAVLAATGAGDRPFEGFPLTQRVQKVQRYSFQRPFIEVYALKPGFDAWRSQESVSVPAVTLAETQPKQFLSRGVPQPRFEVQPVVRHLSSGTFAQGNLEHPFRDRSLVEISEKLKGYPEGELDIIVSDLLCTLHNTSLTPENTPVDEAATFSINTGQFHVVDLGTNLTGFLKLNVVCEEPTRLIATFDETETESDVNWRRLGCVNALLFDLEAGEYALEAFEPHTMRVVKLMAVSGKCTVSGAGLRRYEHPGAARAAFQCADEKLNRIFEAGRTTFAQNAVDIFMDCPHRERAGWLCDSYFTARSALALTGTVDVEHNFIQNFLLPDGFAHLPEGMLPMCYPSDHYDGVFIPNWSLWFVMELGEYAARGGREDLIAAARPKIEALFGYFAKLENEDGLLEKLESWVFVEWSAANKFVQEINYPSNMLYAGALDTAASLFNVPEWKDKAVALRKTIRAQSLKGPFFVDNANRVDGKVTPTDNMTEVCQYFAFYFGVATPETDGELWRILMDEFGPQRQEKGLYKEVHPANAFIGNMLRFELLSREGRTDQTLREMGDYLMYMVERTGTLWENQQDHASLNHGFASHAVVTLYRDVLGAHEIDLVNKRVTVRLNPTALPACSGKLPVGDDFISLAWRQDTDTVSLFAEMPVGFTLQVENNTGKTLNRVDTPDALVSGEK